MPSDKHPAPKSFTAFSTAAEEAAMRSIQDTANQDDHMGLGDAARGQFGRDRVDRGVNSGRAHRANSLMVIAPALLRLASMP